MNFKKRTLATALSLGLALGAGEAAAFIAGVGGIDITDLTIVITNDDGTNPLITSFDFTTTNTANLNGAAIIDQDTCGGAGFPGGNSCGGAGAPLVLDSDIQSLGAAAYTGIGENAFTFVAPTGAEGSASDSVITDAELVGDAATALTHLSQAELTSGTSAGANVQVSSQSNYTMTFTLGGTGTLDFDFLADPELYAELIDATASAGTAGASHTATFTLNGPGLQITWAPRGTAANDCSVLGVGACVETADAEDLNTNVTAAFGGTDSLSYNAAFDAYGAYGIDITGLPAGDYSLILSTTSATNLTRTAAVPEPAILMLLGSGLAGLGFVRRHRRNAV